MGFPKHHARKQQPPLKVSDHAVYRWMERAGVVDIEQVRSALSRALDRAWQAGADMSGGEFLVLSAGLVYVIREGTVVTVLHEDSRHDRARKLSRMAGERSDFRAGDGD